MRADVAAVLKSVDEVSSGDLSRPELAELFGELSKRTAMMWVRIAAPGSVSAPDQLLSVEVAAQRLGVSEDYLYRNHKKYKFTHREGRKLLFSERGLEAHIQTNGRK